MSSWFPKAFNYFGIDQSDDNDKFIRPKLEDFLSSQSSGETKTFRGVISSLKDSEGVINGDIYFNTGLCQSLSDIKVGSCVNGEAQRNSPHDAWRAISIVSQSENDNWSDENQNSEEECPIIDDVVIGKVISIHRNLICIGSYTLALNEDNFNSSVRIGDWLRCKIKKREDSNGILDALKVDPLRKKTIHGTISHIQARNFVINGEVFCDKNLIDWTMEKGSQVIVDIMESDQGGFNWRAISAKTDPLSQPTIIQPLLPCNPLSYSGHKLQTRFPHSSEVLKEIVTQDCNVEKHWGIKIQGVWKFSLLGLGYSDYAKITIKNESAADRILKNIWIHSKLSDPQVTIDDYSFSRIPVLIHGHSMFSVVIECTAKIAGASEESIVFSFDKLNIGRHISFSVGFAPLRMKRLQNKSVVAPSEPGRIIQGERPFHASHFIPMKLPHATVPMELEKLVLGRGNELDFSDSFIQPLNFTNYQKKFSHLLYLEEIELKKQMAKFAMPRASFIHVDDKLALVVPGLAEKRPTLLVGDSVLVSMPSASDSDLEFQDDNVTKYEGLIHEVHHSRVFLKFHREFHSNYKGEDYALTFCFNRTPLKRCHMAVSLVTSQLGPSILFPKELKFQLPQTSYVDSELKMNHTLLSTKKLNLIQSHRLNHLKESKNQDCISEHSAQKISPVCKAPKIPGCKSYATSTDKMCNTLSPQLKNKELTRPTNNPSFEGLSKGSSLLMQPKSSLSLSSKSPHQHFLGKKTANPPTVKNGKNGSKGLFYCTPKVYLKKKLDGNSNSVIMKLEWRNPLLNQEQKVAVRRILEGITRPLPYIILGPPGTGKTVTLVEAVLQVFLLIPHSRILVVAPSNSASDLVTLRLSEHDFITQADLLRLNSFNRDENSVPEPLQKYSQPINNMDAALHHRIIVSTAGTSGFLYTARLKNGHFSHIFIDEAGQLTEPESAIPLGLVNSSSGQIVLAGDPKQLGPVVMSSLAKQYGLGESLLSRLCCSPLYQPDGMEKVYSDDLSAVTSPKSNTKEKQSQNGNKEYLIYEPRLITLLVRSYRAHPALLHIPSSLFYHSSLVSFASQEDCNYLLDWPELPNNSFPLLFHAIVGENQQEGDSPSWFNVAEVFQVASYTKSLLNHGVRDKDIGVITPYRKQVEKIRRMFTLFDIEGDVKVGSVEEFQGQERSAIILSTVRSSKEKIREDVLHDMGFVLSRQRFNVAVTRAKSLLVVIGNPYVLQMDCHWHAFVTYCVENGSYVGVDAHV